MIKTSSLKITLEMLSFVSEIDEFKGAWRALGTLAPERLVADVFPEGAAKTDAAATR